MYLSRSLFLYVFSSLRRSFFLSFCIYHICGLLLDVCMYVCISLVMYVSRPFFMPLVIYLRGSLFLGVCLYLCS